MSIPKRSRSLLPVILTLIALLMASCSNASISNSGSSPEPTPPVAASPQPSAPVSAPPSEAELALFPPDIRAIQQRGKLIIALYSQDRPPFFYRNEHNELVGVDVDLARDIAHAFGVEVEFNRSAQSFDEVTNLVASGKADAAISKLSVTLSRAKKVQFTRPYIVLKQALLINRVRMANAKQLESDPASALDQTQRKIGVKFGTSFIEYAKQIFPQAETVVYEDQNRMMQDVQEGKIDAVLYDENETKKFIYENPERSIDLQLYMLPDYEDRLAIAVPPSSGQFLSWLNLYLEMNRMNLNLDQLLKKYIAAGGKS